ncbi:ATP-dependent helicase C-terminal domain-containing protein [Actinomyces sp. oral taxon 897]|uniref:ATP-dependent helicase C-terminal domain-containing protein n=1 Tax=Actinomyces sp. oral taxon 897 TaxID=2081702 RepID=UPI0020C1E646|nr:ATP-dependent helicase C-terminal domain-containing protein [Actinomyces sp. oral taxon 897]
MSPDRLPDPLAALLASPPDLPVVAALDRLRAVLADAPGPVVVTAPPGTGKTTLVPPLVAVSLADRNPATGRVIVTQPRRLATRAAARRLAGLLGQEVGQDVGYAVRGEHVSRPTTRIEVVTAGLLLRRLQADPELPGTAAVVLDEVHERSLEADLLLTLLLDARALREDLVLVAMSATLDPVRLRRLLGGPGSPAPLVEVPGVLHPVTEHWAPPPGTTGRLGPRGVPREFLAHVAATTLTALREDPGDVLVFAPGAREVDDVVARLRRLLSARDPADGLGEVDVLPLHGRLPAAAQDAALTPSAPGRRRVVVSTNVAESSLTVPGVRVVVDSTLSREPRLDVARGMSGLVTVGASRSSGTQRAGRAGREGPGAVYRCCTPTDWARAPLAPTPEILTADLTRTVLELTVWGVPDGEGLSWLDAPPPAALAAARTVLRDLGLTGADATLTPLGRAVALLPAPVREARALLMASPRLGVRRAAEVTALLTTGLRARGGDLAALARGLRASRWTGRTGPDASGPGAGGPGGARGGRPSGGGPGGRERSGFTGGRGGELDASGGRPPGGGERRAPQGGASRSGARGAEGASQASAWRQEARRLEQAARRALREVPLALTQDPGQEASPPRPRPSVSPTAPASGSPASVSSTSTNPTSGNPTSASPTRSETPPTHYPAGTHSSGAQYPDNAQDTVSTHPANLADPTSSSPASTNHPTSSGPDRPGTLPSHPPAGTNPLTSTNPPASTDPLTGDDAIGLVVALAHPEWLARRRGPAPSPGTEAVYASVGGVGLRLPAASALASCQWLAVADVDRAPGRAEALVRAAVPVDEALALEVAGAWLVEDTRTRWESGRLRSERLRRLGAITLTTTPGPSPSPREAAAAVTRAVAEQGLGILPWSARARQLRGRLDLLHRTLGAPWPDVSPEALTTQAGRWLAPAVTSLAASARRPDLSRLDVTAALRTLLPWPEASRLDELAPERLQVPSGSQVPLSYAQDDGGAGTPLERPVLAVRVQECFGWDATPRVVGGRVAVLIHLLSPARRPVAVTDDLASFWAQGYAQVRAELRGRYPRHAWPQDPWTAPATRGTGRRRAS